jgi:hypothetical protein
MTEEILVRGFVIVHHRFGSELRSVATEVVGKSSFH